MLSTCSYFPDFSAGHSLVSERGLAGELVPVILTAHPRPRTGVGSEEKSERRASRPARCRRRGQGRSWILGLDIKQEDEYEDEDEDKDEDDVRGTKPETKTKMMMKKKPKTKDDIAWAHGLARHLTLEEATPTLIGGSTSLTA